MAKDSQLSTTKITKEYNDEYNKLKRRINYYRKKGYDVPDELLPPKPQRITQGSIRKLKKVSGDYITKHSKPPLTIAKESPTKKPKKESAFHKEYTTLYNKVNAYIAAKAKEGVLIDYTPEPVPEYRSPAKLAKLKEDYKRIKLRVRNSKAKPAKGITRYDTSTGEVTQEAKQPVNHYMGLAYGRGARRESFKERAIREREQQENPDHYQIVHEEDGYSLILDTETGHKRIARLTPTPTTSKQTTVTSPEQTTKTPSKQTTGTQQQAASRTLAGYDDEVEEILADRKAVNQVEALQQILKQVSGSFPRRYPAESLPDYAKRLANALRIRGYQEELGEYDERGDKETQEDYMERLANEVTSQMGKRTLSEKANDMREQLINNLIQQHGFNPFKPVDDSDRVSPEELLDFIVKNRAELGVNLPKWAAFKKDSTLLEHFRQMNDREIRNRFLSLQNDLNRIRNLKERNAQRDAETPDDEIPRFDDIEDITDSLNSLVEKYGYLPAGAILESMRDDWARTLQTVDEKTVRDYLRDNVGEILTMLDEAIDEIELYHLLKGDITPDDISVKNYPQLQRHLRLGRALTFSEAINADTPKAAPVRPAVSRNANRPRRFGELV